MNVIVGTTDDERDATRRFYTTAEKCVQLSSPIFLDALAVSCGVKNEMYEKAEMRLGHMCFPSRLRRE